MKQSYPPVTTKTVSQISQELISMARKDQCIRKVFENDKSEGVLEEMGKIDRENRASFKRIFQKVGFIGTGYGKKAQLSAFLIVQHMPKSEVGFMKKYLSLMKRDLTGINSENFAQLSDRVATWEDKPQIYGTQFMPVDKKVRTYKLIKLTKPKEVDKRRSEIGLEPLDEYLNRIMRKNKVTIEISD